MYIINCIIQEGQRYNDQLALTYTQVEEDDAVARRAQHLDEVVHLQVIDEVVHLQAVHHDG